jgi:NitT/TauT family transport system ATP-binding protein
MMQALLLDVWTQVPTTVLFVTHDIDEALFLADRILVLSQRPARIVADLRVTLPRPRDDETTTDAQFVELKRRCLALLREAAAA